MQSARELLTSCLELEPRAEFFLRRGMAFRLLKDYARSLKDFSQCIHLNPDDARALFYRGCLLSTVNPKQALQDFGTSLLIDNSVANIDCLVHRSQLYFSQGFFREAAADSSSVLDLSKKLPDSSQAAPYVVVANCQQGQIEMNHSRNFAAAIRYGSQPRHWTAFFPFYHYAHMVCLS